MINIMMHIWLIRTHIQPLSPRSQNTSVANYSVLVQIRVALTLRLTTCPSCQVSLSLKYCSFEIGFTRPERYPARYLAG